jgi:hypothetical protein
MRDKAKERFIPFNVETTHVRLSKKKANQSCISKHYRFIQTVSIPPPPRVAQKCGVRQGSLQFIPGLYISKARRIP